MTCEMPRAVSLSVPAPRKSGIAIGNGWTLPWVTSICRTADAGRELRPASAAVALAPSNARRVKRPRTEGVTFSFKRGIS